MPVARLDMAEQHGRLDVRRQESQVADLRQPGARKAEAFRGVRVVAQFAAFDEVLDVVCKGDPTRDRWGLCGGSPGGDLSLGGSYRDGR